jgi:uncharacterized protein YlzI (FlbEa/FlbD family)
MGGTIEIDSEVNRNYLYINKTNTNVRSILCIDDDAITLMLCKKVIVKSSFSHEIIQLKMKKHYNTLNFKEVENQSELPQLIF